MDTSALAVVGYGSLMLTIGLLALTLIVRKDLIPTSVMTKEGRVLVGVVLGFGMITFSLKLAVISAFAAFPTYTIDAQLTDKAVLHERRLAYWEDAALTVVSAPAFDPPPTPDTTWRALPETAPAPLNNPTTPQKIALGMRLFHDPALSADHSVSCASCHDVKSGAGDDTRGTALGITHIPGPRNTPTVYNAAFQARLFWDGRVSSLEAQAKGPLINPEEMGMPSLAAVTARVKADPSYTQAFAQAFEDGADITIDRIAMAIAAYERTLITPETPYDRFVRGDASALTNSQKRGMFLFRSLGCVRCHSGPNFSGASLIGPASPFQLLYTSRSPRALRFGLDKDKGRADTHAKNGIWRVPSLRNVALTGPYFHNGSVMDLAEAVKIMASAQLAAVIGDEAKNIPLRQVWWAPESRTLKNTVKKHVSDDDVADLVAFLSALSSDTLSARKQVLLDAEKGADKSTAKPARTGL